MSIAMSAEHRALGEAVRAYAARARPEDSARAHETDPQRWRSGWTTLADLGVFACALPEPAGAGGTVTDLAVMLEQLAVVLTPGPVLTTALVGLVLAEHDPQDSRLAEMAAGELTAAAVLGSTGVVVDESARVTGTARPVSGAGALLLAARTSDGATTWCLVDADAPGTKWLDLAAGDFSTPLAEVELHAAPATILQVSTERVLALAATLAAAQAAGIAAWALRTAVAYAMTREQFGRPIGAFQAVKHMCAEMLCRSETAAAVAWDASRCADEAGEEEQHAVSAATAAALALDAAVDNTKDCIQVLGGIGFTWEHDAHLYLRRALGLRQFLAGSASWRRRVSELTLAGRRRTLEVDLDLDLSDGADRDAVRTTAQAIAATSEPDRRRALADSGYLMPHWPKPYGLDAAPATQLLVDEELDRAGVTRPDLVIAAWAVPTILTHGSPAQVERFVRPTLYGEIAWCQLFSEPGAGSDLASLRTRAERVEGGWSLTGQKVWTSLADAADWGVCLARSNSDVPKHKGITYFLVDMRGSGLDIRPLREITGEPAFNEVFLDSVFVPDDLVVGEIDGGWPLARTTLSYERVAMGGGSSIGDAVETLVRRATELGAADDVAVRERLGALVADGLAGSVLDLRTTLRRMEGADDSAAASVRKLIGVRHRQSVAEAGLDLLGADGMLAGQEYQNFLLTRCLSIAGGTTQILLSMAAERILGLPRG